MKIKNEIDIFDSDGKTKDEKIIAEEMKKFLGKRAAFYRKKGGIYTGKLLRGSGHQRKFLRETRKRIQFSELRCSRLYLQKLGRFGL